MMPRYCCFSNTKLDWSNFEALTECAIRIFSNYASITPMRSALHTGGLAKMCIKLN